MMVISRNVKSAPKNMSINNIHKNTGANGHVKVRKSIMTHGSFVPGCAVKQKSIKNMHGIKDGGDVRLMLGLESVVIWVVV